MRPRIAIEVLAMVALVTACAPPAPSPTPPDPVPSVPASEAVATAPAFVDVPCPDDVTLVMVVVPTCGVLTVEERRDDPGGPEIGVFVTRIDPPSLDAPDPVVVVGTSLSAPMPHGDVAQVARRTGRVTYLIDRRGSGLSEPVLTCPEMTAVEHQTLAWPSLDPAAIEVLSDAAGACRERLVSDGIDPAAYDLAASALDVRDLRAVLDVEAWNVLAFGSASRLALEVAHADPDGVRTLVLDSVVSAGHDDPIVDIAATAHALDEIAARCAIDAACAGALPEPGRSLSDALAALDLDPLIVPPTEPGTGEVVIDGTRFGRVVRFLMGDRGGERIPTIMSALESLGRDEFRGDDGIVFAIRESTDLCYGRLPDCPDLEVGLMLTTVCRDVMPFIGDAPSPDAVSGLGRAFRLDDWVAVCAAWAVPPAPRDAGAAMLPALPVLMLYGQFDPYTGPLDRADALLPAPGLGLALEVPNETYNAFGYSECPRQVRRAWLDDPTTRVLDTSCFDVEIAPIRVWIPSAAAPPSP